MIVEEIGNTTLQKIFTSKKRSRSSLIPILQDIQSEFGYLSKENMIHIGEYIGMSFNEVYGVASFYKQFKFVKSGKHIITVCLGTACFVKGGQILAETVRTKLGINPDETTEDRLFSFERVACLGCCALSPVVQIDGEVYGEMKPAKLLRIINNIIREENNK
ncbi:MAG: NAD(P)H-dependent oxidoreductase subunit E [Promethearchaeota archaeon]